MSIHYTTKRRWVSQQVEFEKVTLNGQPAVTCSIYEKGELKSTFTKVLKSTNEQEWFLAYARDNYLNVIGVQ